MLGTRRKVKFQVDDVRTLFGERKKSEVVFLKFYIIIVIVLVSLPIERTSSSLIVCLFPQWPWRQRKSENGITSLHVSCISKHELSLIPTMLHVISWSISFLIELLCPENLHFSFHPVVPSSLFKPLLRPFLQKPALCPACAEGPLGGSHSPHRNSCHTLSTLYYLSWNTKYSIMDFH